MRPEIILPKLCLLVENVAVNISHDTDEDAQGVHHLSRHLSKLLCAYQMLGHMPTWGGLCTQGHLSYCFSRFGGRGILHRLGKCALVEPIGNQLRRAFMLYLEK